MTECIAIICARGGSERVPRKNAAILDGRPLLDYTISTARDSKIFNDIVVNSDDSEILDIAASCGASIYKRPVEYSYGNIFIIEVVNEWLRSTRIPMQKHIAVMFPTVPLRNVEDIQKSYSIFIDANCSYSVVSVTPYEYPVQVALRNDERGHLTPFLRDEYKKTTRHDAHEVLYRANYAIVWNTAERLLTQHNLIGESPLPYFMPFERSIDIDNIYQMRLCEMLLQQRDKVHDK